MPTTASTNIIAGLIAKAKGGLRGLGLFSALYRVWAIAKAPWVWRWEAHHAMPFNMYQAGASCIDAVWVQAVRGEVAFASGKASATLLWDMINFFEDIPRDVLAKRERQLGFPGVATQVSINTYGADRALFSYAGCAVHTGNTQVGVPTRCTFATAHVAAHTEAPYLGFCKQDPHGPLRRLH